MILVNGVITDNLPVSDRGLQYGDGVWETVAIRNTKAVWLKEHLARLCRGLKTLGIQQPDYKALGKEINQMCNHSNHQLDLHECILKIIITRGSGGRGYNPDGCDKPTRILSLHSWPEYPEDYRLTGVKLALCQTRLSHNPQLAGFKHLNRLEQVLARAEFGTEYQEGLVRDIEGNVIEATMSNLFLIKKNRTVVTPDLRQCGIEGIARQRVIKQLQNVGIKVHVTQVSVRDVLDAQAVFLTNSIIETWPVRQFQGVTYQASDLISKLVL